MMLLSSSKGGTGYERKSLGSEVEAHLQIIMPDKVSWHFHAILPEQQTVKLAEQEEQAERL